MSGTRIFCNQIIPVTDWNHDYVTVPSVLESQSPLPTLACFDLLNPLDNSGHGYTVSPGAGRFVTGDFIMKMVLFLQKRIFQNQDRAQCLLSPRLNYLR
ncbi:hypothetical protein [Klebsiella pneumoniae]|uniref:hypothetical protein n=1 Tax=Klebsiella pneumoniae TaxID=573 RepID=UPI00388DE351